MAQELALLNFTITHSTGRSNKAVDALSQHLLNLDSSSESDTDSDEVDEISYSSVCGTGDLHLNCSKVSSDL